MQERHDESLRQRWENFQPSKTMLFWSCAASVAAAIVVGFTWGGWVTGGTAKEMAADAARSAHNELAAAVCVERFAAAADARVQLTALRDITSSYRQRGFVEDGGWATMPGSESADRRVASLCAERLSALELPPAEEASSINDDATVAR